MWTTNSIGSISRKWDWSEWKIADLDENENTDESCHENECPETRFDLNIYDPQVWDNLDAKMRDLLVKKGIIKETNLKFPMDEHNRHFSSNYYLRMLLNGETKDWKWLVYSRSWIKCFVSVVSCLK